MNILLVFDSLFLITFGAVMCLAHLALKERIKQNIPYLQEQNEHILNLLLWESRLSIAAFLFAAVFAYFTLDVESVSLANDMLIAGGNRGIFKILIYVFTAVVLVIKDLELSYNLRKTNLMELSYQEKLSSFPFIAAAVGATLAMTSCSLISLIVSIEIISLSLWVMFYAPNENEKKETENFQFHTFFICSLLGGGLLLISLALFAIATKGNLDFTQIAELFNSLDIGKNGRVNIASVAFVFLICGMLLKIGASPFHIWVTEVYSNTTGSVFAMLGVVAIPSLLCVMATLMLFPFAAMADMSLLFLGFVACLTMAWASLAALKMDNIRDFIAFITVANTGLVLTILPFINCPKEVYTFSSLLFFVIPAGVAELGLIATSVSLLKKGKEVQSFSDIKGLGKNYPFRAFLLLFFLLSLVALAPLIGFLSRLSIIIALEEADNYFLVIAVVLASMFAIGYFLKFAYLLYSDNQQEELDELSLSSVFLLGLLCISLIIISVKAHSLFVLCEEIGKELIGK